VEIGSVISQSQLPVLRRGIGLARIVQVQRRYLSR
jgi:hypothetical protein